MSTNPETTWKRLTHRIKGSPFWRLESALVAGAVVVGVGAAALSEANRAAGLADLLERYRTGVIYAADRDLPAGTVLDRGALREAEMLATSVTGNVVDGEAVETVLGRRLAIALKAGDPLLLSAVEGAATTVAGKIPPGKRLATLPVADRAAGNGWVKPNDHVDIVASMDIPGRGKTTFTLMHDVTLVSVGQATVWEDGASTRGSEIGFYVTLEELEFLRFAQDKGEFSLALRNPDDVAPAAVNSRDLGKAGIDMRKFLDSGPVSQASGGGDLPVRVNGGAVPAAKAGAE